MQWKVEVQTPKIGRFEPSRRQGLSSALPKSSKRREGTGYYRFALVRGCDQTQQKNSDLSLIWHLNLWLEKMSVLGLKWLLWMLEMSASAKLIVFLHTSREEIKGQKIAESTFFNFLGSTLIQNLQKFQIFEKKLSTSFNFTIDCQTMIVRL